MAADPDFTEDLLWKNLAPETKQLIMDKGVHEITWGVRTPAALSSVLSLHPSLPWLSCASVINPRSAPSPVPHRSSLLPSLPPFLVVQVTKYPISRSLIEDGRNNFVLRNPSGGEGWERGRKGGGKRAAYLNAGLIERLSSTGREEKLGGRFGSWKDT